MYFFTIISVFLLVACSATIPITYQPQSFMKIGKGEYAIGNFHYFPADEGRVKSNEIKNTALGSIYIATDVVNLVRRATALEFERAGITTNDNAKYEIAGDILLFEADDLGYSVDWNYKINYRFTNKRDVIILIDKIYESKEVRTGKFGGPTVFTPSINEMILDALEQFMNDVHRSGIFGVSSPRVSTRRASPVITSREMGL
jgi:hypothetical protein